MSVRFIKKSKYKGAVTETFYFGAYRGKSEVKATLYRYDDGTAKINLPYFKCLSFNTISEAEEFIRKNFSCKGDLVSAVVSDDLLSTYEHIKPSCLGYFDSKYSFKRQSGQWIWEIINIETGVVVGDIWRNRNPKNYGIRIESWQVANCDSKSEAEKLAVQILNGGLPFKDVVYTHHWGRTMKELNNMWKW